MIMFSWFTSRFSLLCVFLLSNVLACYLGRTNALDESVDWWPFGLQFALILGHACPVVPCVFVCTVLNFLLGRGSIPRRVWRVGTHPFKMNCL